MESNNKIRRIAQSCVRPILCNVISKIVKNTLILILKRTLREMRETQKELELRNEYVKIFKENTEKKIYLSLLPSRMCCCGK